MILTRRIKDGLTRAKRRKHRTGWARCGAIEPLAPRPRCHLDAKRMRHYAAKGDVLVIAMIEVGEMAPACNRSRRRHDAIREPASTLIGFNRGGNYPVYVPTSFRVFPRKRGNMEGRNSKAKRGPQPRAARRYLADRQGPCDPAARRWDERVFRVAMGISTRPAQGSANHQFPFGGTTVSGRSMSHSGVAFLRVHRTKSPEAEVEVHEGWRGLVLLRRAMASDARRRRGFHSADDRAGAGCSAHSRPTDGRVRALRLVVLARIRWQ